MIQRALKEARSAEIATYLKSQPERFFNSLVVATYGGEPSWHPISAVRRTTGADDQGYLNEDTVGSIGFLTLRGDERLFALDGQHRLAGIKRAVTQGSGIESDPYDTVSVILVAHVDTPDGRERTRRLFTTLNKTARPVSKGDIIALDEDDVMAICVRRSIEETDMFSGDRIAFVAGNSMPATNSTSLTTIGSLYDLYSILFTEARSPLRAKKADLQRIRPSDDMLYTYQEYAHELFSNLRAEFKELGEFFAAPNTERVVEKYRGSHGGCALFRPIGLEIFVRIIVRLTEDLSLERSVQMAARLPRNLNEEPYEGLLWDSNRCTILNKHKVTLREILLYMLGKNGKRYPAVELCKRYQRDTGNSAAKLPKQLV